MRKKISDSVVAGEAWASALEKIVQYLPHFLALLAMTGLGSWFASGVDALSKQGWGIYPLVGVAFAVAMTLAFCLVGIGMDFFSRRKERQAALPDQNQTTSQEVTTSAGSPTEKLEMVQNKRFEHERVVLDGKCFVNPRFKDVTLVYNGGPMHLSNMQILGTVKITSDRKDLQNFAHVIDAFKAVAAKIALKATDPKAPKDSNPPPAAASDTLPRPSTEEKTPL